MKKLIKLLSVLLIFSMVILLASCDSGDITEQSCEPMIHETTGIVTSDEIIFTTTSEIAKTTSIPIKENEELTEKSNITENSYQETHEENENYKYKLENIYEWSKIDYGMAIVVRLKENGYNFNTEGMNMEKILEKLWERNIVCFYTYYYDYFNLCHYDNKTIHYFFNNYIEFKEFIEKTYTNEYANHLLYDYRDWGKPFYEVDGNLKVDIYFANKTYVGNGYYNEVKYEITNITDDTCEFTCYFEYNYKENDCIILEVECIAVKENGEWRLPEMIGEVLGYGEKIGIDSDEMIPYETYKVPR